MRRDDLSDAQRGILFALECWEPMTVLELSESVGLHYTTVRKHLGDLENAGWVRRDGVLKWHSDPTRRK